MIYVVEKPDKTTRREIIKEAILAYLEIGAGIILVVGIVVILALLGYDFEKNPHAHNDGGPRDATEYDYGDYVPEPPPGEYWEEFPGENREGPPVEYWDEPPEEYRDG
jgi:hypothetical protein